MREFKFRAWDGEDMLTNLDSINMEELSKGVISYSDHISDQVRVVFMQYTGLKNSLKQEIYEGDVLEINKFPDEPFWRNNGKKIGVVMFEADYGGFIVRFEYSPNHIRLDCDIAFTVKVLGNYTQPEFKHFAPKLK